MFQSIIAENDFGRYCVPRKAKHRPACQAILSGQVYERETIAFLQTLDPTGIVHAGTFFGDFLPALSRHFRDVWAFEPNPGSFRCAEETIRLNGLENVAIRNAGLGAGSGSASLKTRGRWGRYLGGGTKVIDRPGKTRIVAIDEVVDRPVSVIHLDVEGYEQHALSGARETIARYKPVLVLETVPPLMTELDYRLERRVNNNSIFVHAASAIWYL